MASIDDHGVPAAAQNGPSVRWERYDNACRYSADGRALPKQQRIVVEQGPLRLHHAFDLEGRASPRLR